MGFDGLVVVSDPYLQRRFTQTVLRALQQQYAGLRDAAPTGRLRLRDLPAALTSLGGATATAGEKENSSPEMELTEEEWASVLKAVARADEKPLLDVNFELFLRLRLKGGKARDGGGGGIRRSSSTSAAFLTASTTTLLHTISESEKASYVGHINAYLAEDPFLKKALPVNPATDQLFHLTKDGVLLCKLINLAVPGTIDERAINTKRLLNLWEKNENHTLCLNSVKAIGCTVVNIGTQDCERAGPLSLSPSTVKGDCLGDSACTGSSPAIPVIPRPPAATSAAGGRGIYGSGRVYSLGVRGGVLAGGVGEVGMSPEWPFVAVVSSSVGAAPLELRRGSAVSALFVVPRSAREVFPYAGVREKVDPAFDVFEVAGTFGQSGVVLRRAGWRCFRTEERRLPVRVGGLPVQSFGGGAAGFAGAAVCAWKTTLELGKDLVVNFLFSWAFL